MIDRRWLNMGILCVIHTMLTGCMMARSSTTERTAVEQALLSQAAEETIQSLDYGDYGQRVYFIKKDHFEAVDEKYILAVLNRELLRAGLREADREEEADLWVYPYVAHAGIDGSSFLIGIPEFPLIIPGMGSLTIPEMALFKYKSQIGRNRMGFYAKDPKNDGFVSSTGLESSQKYYNRWTILFLINFRTTDLKAPH